MLSRGHSRRGREAWVVARARFTTAFNIYKINKIENEILFTLLAPEALAQTVMLEYGHALS